MNDYEIVKALECCIDGYCRGCVYGDTNQMHCKDDLMQNALDLINHLQAKVDFMTEQRDVYMQEATELSQKLDRYAERLKQCLPPWLHIYVDTVGKEVLGECQK